MLAKPAAMLIGACARTVSTMNSLEFVECKVYEAMMSFPSIKQIPISSQSFKDIGLSSLDSIELICSIEDTIGFSIPTDEAIKINSVNSAIQSFLACYRTNINSFY